MTDTGRILKSTAHRPWPLPRAPWIMFQSWRDLMFCHWPVPFDRLRSLVPDVLPVDTFDGTAWLGLAPFLIEGLRPRFLPPLPGLSSFPEMNLRTYVTYGGKPGIYFFTLDADNALAVHAARTFYRLPYRRADMKVERENSWIHYSSVRPDGAIFRGRYQPVGPPAPPVPGSLEHFLTERYALYTVGGTGRVWRGDIHHRPWPLQPARAEIEQNTVPAMHGFDVDARTPALLHFSAVQDTLVWPLTRAE